MDHPLRIPLHISGRAKPHGFMYFRMCAQSLIRYKFASEALSKLHHLDPRYDDLMRETEEASVQPVIFAGMCLEATLYDLAACLFGEEFAQRTEKLDPLGKFVVLAQCVDKKAPKKSHAAYQSIQALVTARNRLVHYKSQPVPEENLSEFMVQATKAHTQHVSGIAASFRALVLLSLYFDGNIFEELRILPSFKKPEHWESVVPCELHTEVHRCIEISLNARKQATDETAK